MSANEDGRDIVIRNQEELLDALKLEAESLRRRVEAMRTANDQALEAALGMLTQILDLRTERDHWKQLYEATAASQASGIKVN